MRDILSITQDVVRHYSPHWVQLEALERRHGQQHEEIQQFILFLYINKEMLHVLEESKCVQLA